METICQWISRWEAWIFIPIILAGLVALAYVVGDIFQTSLDDLKF